MKVYKNNWRAVVECEPALRTIVYSREQRRIRLSIPYQIWDINFANPRITKLYFRQAPIEEGITCYYPIPCYYPMLTNVYFDCRVCFGSSVGDVLIGKNKDKFIQTLISHFWQSVFNCTLTDCLQRYNVNLDEYAKQTKQNPEYWKTMKLLKYQDIVLP